MKGPCVEKPPQAALERQVSDPEREERLQSVSVAQILVASGCSGFQFCRV